MLFIGVTNRPAKTTYNGFTILELMVVLTIIGYVWRLITWVPRAERD